jgi:hypothetical protein
MSKESVNMTYRLSDGTETTYSVELQPESDYNLMDKKFYQAGVQAEQERILKLLEKILVGQRNGLAYCYECDGWDELYPDVVALIKGEK